MELFKERYTITDSSKFEKLLNTVLDNNFDDFSKCEDDWKVVETGIEEIKRVFESALNVSISLRDEDKIEYCQMDNLMKLLKSGHVIYAPYFVYRLKTDDEKCPICGANISPQTSALSRRDNKTYICSECGLREALNDLELESNEKD